MKVVLAEHSGFCFGVKKAIDRVFHEVTENHGEMPMYSLGPLIHNQQVVNRLTSLGVKVINQLDEIDQKGNIIIRSHGVSERLYTAAQKKASDLIDTTCPFVKRIQDIVKLHHDQGEQVVIIGDAAHPEVIAINGWCQDTGIIIRNKADLDLVPTDKPICVVVQTTMSIPLYEDLIAAFTQRFSNMKIYNTICRATEERQMAARKLAKEVDAMIVVGGFHSSNTQKLVSICQMEKPHSTFHIETIEQLDLTQLSAYQVVGITAGASTPDWVIQEVVHALEN